MTAAAPRRALIASGSGRYADPWHPFDATSAALADILTGAGFDTTVVRDLDEAMTTLDGVDLLVVNAGDPWSERAARGVPAAAVDGFRSGLARGLGVLAMHCSVSSMRDYPEWAPAIGAIWLPNVSFHPEAGVTIVRPEERAGAGGGAASDPGVDLSTVGQFVVHDERYCALQPIGRSDVVAWHEGDGVPEPAAWVRRAGAARIAVDVLGHDERSYKAPGHRALIAHLARWAADGADR